LSPFAWTGEGSARVEFLFGGRLGRLGYFGYSLGFGILIALVALPVLRLFPEGVTRENAGLAAVLLMLLYAITAFVGWVLTVKRLHDLGLSGWYYLAIIVLQAALYAVMFTVDSKDVRAMALGAQLLVWFMLCFWPGTQGPNPYGER
jgi:uncharacterized membrane protein YhaH (DUF805 family)